MRRHSDDKCPFTPVPPSPRRLSFHRVREPHDQCYFCCRGKSGGRTSYSGVWTEHVVDDDKAATEVRSTREVVVQIANRNTPRRSLRTSLPSKLCPGEANRKRPIFCSRSDLVSEQRIPSKPHLFTLYPIFCYCLWFFHFTSFVTRYILFLVVTFVNDRRAAPDTRTGNFNVAYGPWGA